jgi:Arc/MetJ-type ribon-helix-helix transcriptional regulator
MTPLRPTNIRIDSELLEGMQIILERDGVSISEQVRRAIRLWLGTKGVKVKAERPRAGTRKRA